MKFFSLILLLFITVSNCLAINDCRFVRNQLVMECIRQKVESSSFKVKCVLKDQLYIDYQSAIFAINDKNMNEAVVFVPVLNFDKSKTVCEAITSIIVKESVPVNDIFNFFVQNSSDSQLKFTITDLKIEPFRHQSVRYIPTMYLYDFINPFFDAGVRDRVFYTFVVSKVADISFDNLRLVFEDSKGETAPQQFVFEKSGGIKPISLKQSPVKKIGFLEKLLGRLFWSSSHYQDYARLSTTAFGEHQKLE